MRFDLRHVPLHPSEPEATEPQTWAAPGDGEPLPEVDRRRFEPLIGRSLASVRVHEGPKAEAEAEAVGARAIAGPDRIVLGAGIAAPERAAVIAHELIHAVALSAAPEGGASSVEDAVGLQEAPEEREAERLSWRLLMGERVHVPPDTGAVIRRLPDGEDGDPLVLHASSFEDAAGQMKAILDELSEDDGYRLVVVGATSVAVFDRAGVGLGVFRLRIPAIAAAGVHVATSPDRPLQRLVRSGQGYLPGGISAGNLDFSEHLDRQEEFSELLRNFIALYIVPVGTDGPEPARTTPEEPDPLVRFSATGQANADAWPGAVIPLTPLVTATNTMGSFLMRIENNAGHTTLERVGNLLQPIDYRWEVLKLDPQLQPMDGETRQATRLDAAGAHYQRRLRDLAADRATMLGEHPERQSLPERMVREYYAEQLHRTRRTLAMTGETVMTVIRAVTGSPENPFSEDILDIPFDEPGDYFVRCLATPVSNAGDAVRRATTVAGVVVWVFDIAELAEDALGTDAAEVEGARSRIQEIEEALAAEVDEGDTSPGAVARRERDRAFLGFERTYQQQVADSGGDRTATLLAERAWIAARVEWYERDDTPAGDESYRASRDAELEQLRGNADTLIGLIERSTGRLGSDFTHTGTMQALLVDEAVGSRTELTFSIGEQILVVTQRTEIQIADITSGEGGRVFSGMGDGWGADARASALRVAMRDLRQNLDRGRGYLAYRVPPAYRGVDLELPNPMQLQLSVADQAVETADDLAHAATLLALLAAPFTAGASLEILAVLAPVQAATGLYRLVNRSMYQDLRLDAQAVSDFINIATLGLGDTGGVTRFASRGVQIAATTRNVAILLLDGGNYLVMGWETFRELTAEDSSEDPREGRRRRLLALLNLLEGASIPVAAHMWPPGSRPRAGREAPRPEGGAEPRALEISERAAAAEGPGAARTAVDAEGRLADFPQLRRGLPSDLAGSLPIVRETSPDFARTTVRVEYTVDANGVITEIRLRVGRDVSFRHIAEHVGVVRAMQRYQGLSGRVRAMLRRVGAWLRLHPDAGPGTRAFEARLELQKLPPIIRARARELADPRTSSERRAELIREIADLERQYEGHAASVEAMVIDPGRGYVAAEGLSSGAQEAARQGLPRLPDPNLHASDGTPMGEYYWRFRRGTLEVVNSGEGPKVLYDPATGQFRPDLGAPQAEARFTEGASRREAYEALGGLDPAREFGRYTAMLLAEGLAADHFALIEALQEPAGLRHRTVRSNLKQLFSRRVLEHLTDPERLSSTAAYRSARRRGRSHAEALASASHAEMVRITRALGVADRGAIAERWYEARHGSGEGETPTQVTITQAEAAEMGVTLSQDRRLDRVRDGTIEEVKNVQTRLGERDRQAIDDALQLVGHEIAVRGEAHTIELVKVAMLDPEGVLANASYMYQRLAPRAERSRHLAFEIHNVHGETLSVTRHNRSILNDPAALRAWVMTGRRP